MENEKIDEKVKNLDEKIAARIKFNNKKNNKKFNLNKKYIEENDNIDENMLKEYKGRKRIISMSHQCVDILIFHDICEI